MPTPRKTAKATQAAKTETIKGPLSGADILGRVKPKRRIETVEVCLRADLVAEHEEADAELTRMKMRSAGGSNRMHPGAEALVESEEFIAQANKVRDLEDQIKAAMIPFAFESMNKDEWRAMLDNYPPRKGDQMDHVVGYDRDTVMEQMVRRSLVSPEFEDCTEDGCEHEDCGTWDQLLEFINPSEWGELRDTANRANSAVVEAPFSDLASRTLDRRANA